MGFRYALRDEAERLGITGWVRNRSDGSVQALLQGETPAIERLIGWARRGPPGAHVAALEDEPLEREFARDYPRFEIRPTS